MPLGPIERLSLGICEGLCDGLFVSGSVGSAAGKVVGVPEITSDGESLGKKVDMLLSAEMGTLEELLLGIAFGKH
jgi:hypothetical protein